MTTPGADSAGRRLGEKAAFLASLDETELVVEKLVTGGDGFARLEGIPILVPRAAPGDRLRVRLTERRPDYARAEIVEILEPGPSRREPPCPHYSRCGGCDLQHIEEKDQLRFKIEASVETLRRLGKVELREVPVIHAGDRWGYRTRTQVQVENGEDGPRVGYHSRRSHEVVSVQSCAVLRPEIESLVTTLGRRLPEDPPRRIDVAAGTDGALGVAPVIEGLPHEELALEIGDVRLGFDARCFVQGHSGLIAKLVEEAVDRVESTPTDPEATAYDLYAGIGLFSVFLARRYPRVVAVEADRLAARYARRNLRSAKGAKHEVVHRRVERWIERLPPGAARVVVDPPRSGLPTGVRRALLAKEPQRISYVSCQPATLARDLGVLGDRYRIERLAFLDLFPQTSHLETVVQLVHRADPRAAKPGGEERT